jgi:hypothetical protein
VARSQPAVDRVRLGRAAGIPKGGARFGGQRQGTPAIAAGLPQRAGVGEPGRRQLVGALVEVTQKLN